MTKQFRQYIESTYNAEYKKGREKNFFLLNWWKGDECWFELVKITTGCSFTVKCTNDEAEMLKFMEDYKLVAIFA